jgi:Na+/proline symporter
MHVIDYIIFVVYMLAMLGVGLVNCKTSIREDIDMGIWGRGTVFWWDIRFLDVIYRTAWFG